MFLCAEMERRAHGKVLMDFLAEEEFGDGETGWEQGFFTLYAFLPFSFLPHVICGLEKNPTHFKS